MINVRPYKDWHHSKTKISYLRHHQNSGILRNNLLQVLCPSQILHHWPKKWQKSNAMYLNKVSQYHTLKQFTYQIIQLPRYFQKDSSLTSKCDISKFWVLVSIAMKLFYNTKLTNKLTTNLTNNGVISKTLANERKRDIKESLVDFQILTYWYLQ